MSLLKDEKIEKILELKGSISQLIGEIRSTKVLCEKHGDENAYIKEYIGSLAKPA